MKKLKLDELAVESFTTASGRYGAPGTVHARESDELVTNEAACNPDPGTYKATCYVEFGCMETGGSGAVCCPSETCSAAGSTCDFSCQWGWNDTCA